MRHQHQSTPPVPPLENAFAPAYLAHLREQEEVLTAAEAEMAGPWKEVPLRGKPGAVAVLREWEEVDAGDRPVAVWWHEETARLWSILLPAIEREPLFHLQEEQTPSEWLEIQFERLEIHFRRPEIDFAWLEIHFG